MPSGIDIHRAIARAKRVGVILASSARNFSKSKKRNAENGVVSRWRRHLGNDGAVIAASGEIKFGSGAPVRLVAGNSEIDENHRRA